MIAPLQTVDADSVRAVLRKVYAAAQYDWDLKADPLQPLRDAFRSVMRWFTTLEADHPVAYYALVAALVVVLAAILTHLGYLIYRALRPRRDARELGRPAPAPVRDAAWHLAEARRLAGAGRYVEALAHRYAALLLELELRHLVVFHPSKTPAEYVHEASLDERGRGMLDRLVGTLYRHAFGGEPCSAQDIEAFDRDAQAIVRSGVVA